MWIYWFMVASDGMLMILSSGEEVTEEVIWYRKPFWRAARYLAEKLPGKKKKGKLEKEAAKLEVMLICFTAGMLMVPLIEGTAGEQEKPLESYRLERPERGQGSSSYTLQAEIQSVEEAEPIRLELEERQYTDQEKKELLKKAKEEINQVILGDNQTPDEVRGRVLLPSELQDGEVTVQWMQDPEGLLDAEGYITEELPEKGAILTLTAMLTCSEKEELYEMALHLYPALRSQEEQIRHDLGSALKTAKEESQEKKEMELPRQIDGKKIVWMEKQESVTPIALALLVLITAAGYFGKAGEQKKEEEQRERQLLLDYPDLVFKMGMLLNAGLTIQNAFTRIAAEYRETKRKEHVRWAYEEMVIACNEMKSGIPEARAYERFGRRCGQTCYVRLGTILSGSLQKSSEGMTKLLLDESVEAMEERRQLARKMGEEAGTKLLFPMILMLMVVLVILIVPAVLAF